MIVWIVTILIHYFCSYFIDYVYDCFIHCVSNYFIHYVNNVPIDCLTTVYLNCVIMFDISFVKHLHVFPWPRVPLDVQFPVTVDGWQPTTICYGSTAGGHCSSTSPPIDVIVVEPGGHLVSVGWFCSGWLIEWSVIIYAFVFVFGCLLFTNSNSWSVAVVGEPSVPIMPTMLGEWLDCFVEW